MNTYFLLVLLPLPVGDRAHESLHEEEEVDPAEGHEPAPHALLVVAVVIVTRALLVRDQGLKKELQIVSYGIQYNTARPNVNTSQISEYQFTILVSCDI